jgi:hypothetical protein
MHRVRGSYSNKTFSARQRFFFFDGSFVKAKPTKQLTPTNPSINMAVGIAIPYSNGKKNI